MKKGIIQNLSPFNNKSNMTTAEYIIKKVLAFILIYGVSALLGEGIIIGILYAMGYDPLHGIMPQGQISELLVYYGFLVFSAVTFLYCRVVEKKNLKRIGFSGNPVSYLAGALMAVVLLAIIIGIGCVCGSIRFYGLGKNVSISSLLLWALAFGIQGATEEIMCRGFLLHALKDRVSAPLAIFVSSTAFVFPHLSSLLEAEFVYVVIGLINLYLISAIFSVLVMRRANIWSACGLHSAWNFILYTIMGLTVSGSESASQGVVLFGAEEASVLNGAQYGVEASVITTAVLGFVLFVMAKRWKGRITNGISQ